MSVYTALYGATYGGPAVFPAVPLDVRTELCLSGVWTDITAYVMQDPVVIGRGHPDESTQTTASTCGLTLDNSDGRFSATNPAGPYYGSLIRNVPVRVSVPEGATYLRLENDGPAAASSYASCPDSAGVSITGDMDIQLDLTCDNWNAGLILAGKWAETGNQRTWLLLLNDTGTLTLVISTTGSNSRSMVSTAAVPLPPLLRLCVRATYATATGVTTFYTAAAGNLASAAWTQLGATVTSGLTASLFDSTAPVQAGWCSDAAAQTNSTPGIEGKVHALRLLSGIGGTVEASPDFTAQTAGATSFTDAQSNTWTTHGTSEISDRKYRFHGEAAAVPQSSAPMGTNVKIAVSAGGLLRRLGRAQAPVSSALTRANLRFTGNLAPVAYWPGEDLAGATQIASGTGGPAMGISSGQPLQLASFSGFACSAPIPVLAGATFAGAVPQYAGSGDCVLRFLMAVPSSGDTDGGVLARVAMTGTCRYMNLIYGAGGTLQLQGWDRTGATLFDSGLIAFAVNGQLLYAGISLQQSGSSVTWQVQTLAPGAASALSGSGTITTATAGNVSGVLVNPKGLLSGTAAGQWTVQSEWDSLFDMLGPLEAWAGETAGNRFARLCSEEGIAFRGRGRLADTTAMGAQTQQTLAALLQECADADRGIWTEPRQCLGWGYRTRVATGNQAPAVVLDWNSDHLDHPLQTTEDDQIIVNDVAVTNADGSSSRQVQETGPLSVQSPQATPPGVGRYDQQFTVNLASDSQLDSLAGWILHMGTVAEPRYPAISIDLADTALAALYYAILDADLGDRAQITNPPAWLPPGLIDQIIQGTTENLFIKVLTEAWAGVPASPWNTAYADDLVYGRADTDGSTLNGTAAYGAATISVATGAGYPLWTTSAADFPFGIQCSGMDLTISDITGTSSPQTFTVSAWGVNGVVKNLPSGADVRLAVPVIVSL